MKLFLNKSHLKLDVVIIDHGSRCPSFTGALCCYIQIPNVNTKNGGSLDSAEVYFYFLCRQHNVLWHFCHLKVNSLNP